MNDLSVLWRVLVGVALGVVVGRRLVTPQPADEEFLTIEVDGQLLPAHRDFFGNLVPG